MPFTLGSTAPLRGEKPKPRFTLVVTSHGRWEYLDRAMRSLAPLTGFFDRMVFSFDGCSAHDWRWWRQAMSYEPPCVFLSTGRPRQGLTANLAQAWGALTHDDEWVLHLEEDFVLHDAPLAEMAETLEAFPQVANMVLLRQPWNAAEIRAGSVLKAQHYDMTDRGGWLEHHGGFWLNPMVAHASLLRSLQPGVETELTAQCKSRGLSFGYYGGLNDPPRCTHIGAEGGMSSAGWLP